jgi:hypothetical protein
MTVVRDIRLVLKLFVFKNSCFVINKMLKIFFLRKAQTYKRSFQIAANYFRINIGWGFSCILLLSSIQSKEISSQFSNRSKLFADKALVIEDFYIKMPRIYNLTDSTLIIASSAIGYSSNKHMIYIVSKKTGKIVKSLGEEGSGPEEMMAINNISTLNNEILFYDAVSLKILCYNYTNDSVRFQTVASQKKFFFIRNLYLIKDNKFLSSGMFGKNMYTYGDITTGEGSYYLEYPYLPDVSNKKNQDLSFARSYAYAGAMVKHPDLPKFVYYSSTAEYMQITELNGDTLKEIIHLNFAPPIGKVAYAGDAYIWLPNKVSKACFIGGTASDKYIYLLYSGKLMKENDNSNSKYIVVFDWYGNKIIMIELDKEVYGITVDKEDKEIFAYSTNNETLNNEILRYVLKENSSKVIL